MLLHRFREGAEDNSQITQLLLERSRHGDTVENRIHRHACQVLLFFEWNAQFLVGAQDFGIQFLQAREAGLLFGRGVINDFLVVDRPVLDIGPLWFGLRLLQRRPVVIRLQPPLEHELRFILLGRDQANNVLVESLWDSLFLDRSDEAPLVFPLRQVSDRVKVRAHCILPDTKPIAGTRFPRAFLMVVRCKGWLRSESITFSSAPRTAWLMIR